MMAGKGFKARFANGVVSALIVIVFLAHGTLGAISIAVGFASPLSWLVWGGMLLIGLHVVLSIITSKEQLNDSDHPPSVRKKRHLALKWFTGVMLAFAAGLHIASMLLPGMSALHTQATGALLILMLSAALAIHLCVGSKSLLKDIGVDRRYKNAFRAIVIVFAVGFSLVAVVALL